MNKNNELQNSRKGKTPGTKENIFNVLDLESRHF